MFVLGEHQPWGALCCPCPSVPSLSWAHLGRAGRVPVLLHLGSAGALGWAQPGSHRTSPRGFGWGQAQPGCSALLLLQQLWPAVSPGMAEISCRASVELLPVSGARIPPSWALLQCQSSALPGMDRWIPQTLLCCSCRTFPWTQRHFLVLLWTRGLKLQKSPLQRALGAPTPLRTHWDAEGSGMLLAARWWQIWLLLEPAHLPACRCSSGHCRSLLITFLKPQPLICISVTAEGPEGPWRLCGVVTGVVGSGARQKVTPGTGVLAMVLGQQQLWVQLCSPCPLCCVPQTGQGILVLLVCPQGSEGLGATSFPLPVLCPH